MKKAQKSALNLKKLLIIGIPLVILVIAIFAYCSRGWIRKSGAAWVIHNTVARDTNTTGNAELNKLRDPFHALGYDSFKITASGCDLTYAKAFTAQYVCTYSIEAYRVLDEKDTTSKAELNDSAKQLMQKLHDNGWDVQYDDTGDYTSLTKLVSNLTQDIDYTPDAAYIKTYDGLTCILDTNTAFSTPAPAAMATHFSCSRTVNVFGQPSADDLSFPLD